MNSSSKSLDEELLLGDTSGDTSVVTSPSSRRKNGFLCGDMFPTFSTFVIFVAYVSLFVNQGILVTATKTGGKNTYDYSIVAVVLLTEVAKLLVSVVIFLFQERSLRLLINEVVSNYKLCFWYFVPAGLYCLYNNLAFLNLAWYDPTTYFILLQIRVLLTGAIFQVVFHKRLTAMQWCALIVLTTGCIIKQINFASGKTKETLNGTAEPSSESSSDLGNFITRSFFNYHFVLMLTQVFCSCVAGVYNEYLLKEKGSNAHIMIQNVFMYLDSCVCNILVLIFVGTGSFGADPNQQIDWYNAFASVFKFLVICIMINNCTAGIVTSMFLKHLNSIVKVFASAFELSGTALMSWILFGIAINIPTALAIIIVSVAMYLYTVNPVVNLPKSVTTLSPKNGSSGFKSTV